MWMTATEVNTTKKACELPLTMAVLFVLRDRFTSTVTATILSRMVEVNSTSTEVRFDEFLVSFATLPILLTTNDMSLTFSNICYTKNGHQTQGRAEINIIIDFLEMKVKARSQMTR